MLFKAKSARIRVNPLKETTDKVTVSHVNNKAPNLETLNWGDLTWIHMERPTKLETEYLGSHFPFHPLNLDDVLSIIQRPKIDDYKDHMFIVLHFPYYNPINQAIISSEVDFFIGNGFLVSIDCSGNLKSVAKFFKLCQTSEDTLRGNFIHGSGYLLYRIVDKLVDDCIPLLDMIGENIDHVENHIFTEGIQGAIQEISNLRRNAITFRRIIWPMRAVVASLESKTRRFTKIDLADYFGDTIDHVDKIWDALDEYKEIIEGLNATHDSLASNRNYDVLRVLTILATVGTVLTVISSFYGMNIPLPGAAVQGHPFVWVVLLIISLMTTGAMLYYFRRKGWF